MVHAVSGITNMGRKSPWMQEAYQELRRYDADPYRTKYTTPKGTIVLFKKLGNFIGSGMRIVKIVKRAKDGKMFVSDINILSPSSHVILNRYFEYAPGADGLNPESVTHIAYGWNMGRIRKNMPKADLTVKFNSSEEIPTNFLKSVFDKTTTQLLKN